MRGEILDKSYQFYMVVEGVEKYFFKTIRIRTRPTIKVSTDGLLFFFKNFSTLCTTM